MEFRILGPLEAYEAGKQIPVGGAKQRALLAVLLLQANRVVASDRLIDALWDEQPPETARKAVQVYVSQLRKLLGADVLVTRSPGYLLRVEPGMLDLDRFEALRREARDADPEIAADKLREALALFRGRPLADLANERFAQGEIARLEELGLAALEERIEAELRLGLHAELASELEALAAENPLRERLCRQRMVALYRCGRQAEALEVYQAARRELVEELGIEPGRELRELHQAILRQDSALELETRPAAEATPDARGAFVGRESELAEIMAGLDDAVAGRGRLFLLQGEPGIGKSRLADELMSRAKARGVRVLTGRCWEAGGAPAYWPWTQSLRAYVRGADPPTLRRQLGDAVEVAQIVPELRELFSGLPAPERAESEAARFHLFDSTASFLKEISIERALALVLDDLHAADEPSLLLLRYVASVLGDSRTLIVGTFRDLDPMVRDPLESTLAELGREPVTRRIHLSGLSRDEVGQLAEVTASKPPPNQLVTELHAETDGNPLFVSEIVRLLAAEGRLTSDAPVKISIPESIREVIGRRLRRLSGECRRVLSLASVFGREFGIVALERVADYTGIDKLLSVLDEALTARVIEEVPGVLGRLRFGHALTRDTLYEEIPATHRARLHRRVAEVLEALYAGNPDAHLAELAHHFSAAVPAAAPSKAIEYGRRAGDQAARLLAYEEAVRLYRLALKLTDAEGTAAPGERCELLLALGDVEARADDMPAAKETFLCAAEIARELGSGAQLARAALGYGGRFSFTRAGADPHLVPLLEEALAAVGDGESAIRARLLARLAGTHRGETSHEPRASLAREAIDVARRVGDVATLGYVLEGASLSLWHRTDVQQRLAIGGELISISERAGDKERAVLGRTYRFVSFIELGDIAAADIELAQMATAAEELRQPAQLSYALVCRAMRALLVGAFAEAEELIREVFRLGEVAEPSGGGLDIRLQLYALRREQGRLAELEETVRRSVDEYSNYPVWRCVLAHFHAEQGRIDEAREVFEALAQDDFSRLPLDEEWLFGLSLLSEACVTLADAARARTLYELLLPFAGLVVYGAPEVSTGAVARYLGLLSATGLRFDEAERHFEDALALNATIGARPWLARTQCDYARMLIARDGSGDRKKAQELLDAALATYRELGMESYAAKASALAREAAVSAR
jgi:DNA-binding SARP family transcriptional activator